MKRSIFLNKGYIYINILFHKIYLKTKYQIMKTMFFGFWMKRSLVKEEILKFMNFNIYRTLILNMLNYCNFAVQGYYFDFRLKGLVLEYESLKNLKK